jgi:dsRNA-specific ribonuclease
MTPALPPVQGEATLAIFVHPSLRSHSAPNERFGDGERLAFIGQRVLQMVLAEIYFEKRPMLSAVELEVSALSWPLRNVARAQQRPC